MIRRGLLRGGAAMLGVLGVTAAVANGSSQVTLHRCPGSVHTLYGANDFYPFHLTCGQARGVITGINAPHVHIVVASFGPATGDAFVARYAGADWVCGGSMGGYFCGYPYIPTKVNGRTFYKTSFTKYVAYDACKVLGKSGCTATIKYTPQAGATDKIAISVVGLHRRIYSLSGGCLLGGFGGKKTSRTIPVVVLEPI